MSSYTLTDLGTGTALDINDSGNVVGTAEMGAWYRHPGGRITIKSKTAQGFFFTAITATQIWNDDTVVGSYLFIPNDPSSAVGFRWQIGWPVSASWEPVNPPSTRTSNPEYRVGSKDGHATITELKLGSLTSDLNFKIQSPGWVLQTANAINAKGQIVGGGTLNGAQHAYLLTPVANRVSRIESYAGFYIEGMAGKTVRVLASDTEWGGEWRDLETVQVTSSRQLWIDTSTPRRRNRDYRVEAL